MEHEGLERIAQEILYKAGLHQPVHVEIRSMGSKRRKPSSYSSSGKLTIVADHESQVRRLAGIFAVKGNWSSYKWYPALHPYRLAIVPSLLISFISLIDILSTTTQLDNSQLITLISIISSGIVLLFFSYVGVLKHPDWSRNISEFMKEIGAVSEYDGNLHDYGHHVYHGTWILASMLYLLLFGFRLDTLALDIDIAGPLLILFFGASIPSFFIGSFGRLSNENCFDDNDWKDGEIREPTEHEASIAARLEEIISTEIEDLDLSEYFKREADWEGDAIRVIFREIPFAHCRLFHHYTEDNVLVFEIQDMSEEAAINLLDSRLRRLATSYFRTLGLRWRMLILFNLLFLIFFFLTLPLMAYAFGILVAQLALAVGVIIMSITSWINYRHHREAQKSYLSYLEDSKYLTDYDKQHYYDDLFGGMTKYDIYMLAAFLILAATIERIIILWL